MTDIGVFKIIPPRIRLAWTRFAGSIQSSWKTLVIWTPFFWLLIFFLAPFFIVAKISLAELVIASPPFSNMVQWVDGSVVTIRLVFDNFIYI